MARGGEVRLLSGGVIPEIGEAQSYKYLGVHQCFGAKLKATKARVIKEFMSTYR